MVVTEQVEALEALGLAPVQMLVVPRLLALAIMMPILTIFADIVSVVGGMWLAGTVAHISNETFIQSARQTVGIEDVLKGVFKAFVFGIIRQETRFMGNMKSAVGANGFWQMMCTSRSAA